MTDPSNEGTLTLPADSTETAEPDRSETAESPVESKPATASTPPAPRASRDGADGKLDELLSRISKLTKTESKPTSKSTPEPESSGEFYPPEPASFADACVSESEAEALILKLMLGRGDQSGRQMSDHVKLPFALLEPLLRQLKLDQVIVHKGSAPMNDYIYHLTDVGTHRAKQLASVCSYFGAAPVSLADYAASVKAQSLTTQHPTIADLKRAFSDLLIGPDMIGQLGPAINSGKGMFLFGAPGNGKTSIAERVTKVFGEHIWIPRSIGIEGEIVRVFDPVNHEEIPPPESVARRQIDRRWVCIRRPTIIVGGELTMDHLEITFNEATKISEAPVQIKSNCGTLVIDDFGRQRMTTSELLNRWIVPLEKRYDFLSLANGKKIKVPFDQLIVFSTNLEPRNLVDDAFLRRIPFKVEVCDPSEEQFRNLFKLVAPKMGFEFREDAMNHLVEKHYRPVNRPFRSCHARDLLFQIRCLCYFEERPLEMNAGTLDFACKSYFAVT